MSTRTGLAAHVPSAALCLDMARIPALAEAFKRSYAAWVVDGPCLPGNVRYALLGRISEMEFSPEKCPPAPLVDEMLAWLDNNGWWRLVATLNGEVRVPNHDRMLGKAYDPDALARAVIEASK